VQAGNSLVGDDHEVRYRELSLGRRLNTRLISLHDLTARWQRRQGFQQDAPPGWRATAGCWPTASNTLSVPSRTVAVTVTDVKEAPAGAGNVATLAARGSTISGTLMIAATGRGRRDTAVSGGGQPVLGVRARPPVSAA